jgi:sec-independent protein translocase protein TatB
MFGIGFWELAFILLLGLLVLGPEKLPRAIRTVGYYWRKLRTVAISAQQQIERELDAEEMRRYLAEDKQRESASQESAESAQPPVTESESSVSGEQDSDSKHPPTGPSS